MKGFNIILITIADFFCRPFYKDLFFTPFDIKIGKYPIYKQIQYFHFITTRKFRNCKETVTVKLNKNNNFCIEVIPGADFHQMHLYMAGSYEKSVSEKLLKDLKSSDVFIDVGSYIGYYSLMASVFFPEIQIFAFEPQNEAIEKLKKNIKINHCHNIKVNHCALGDINESKYLNINKYPEQTSLFSSPLNTIQQYEIQIKRLDDLLEISQKNVVVKIDTEGYEFEVLKGMSEILKNNHCTVYFEYNPKIYKEQFDNDYSLINFQLMEERGYRILKIKDHGVLEAFLFNSQSLEQQMLVAKKIIKAL